MSSRSRFRLVALLATAVLVAVTAGGIAMAAHVSQRRAHAPHRLVFHGTRSRLTAAQIKRLSARANKRTIIIFKNQLGRLPATRSNTRARVTAALAAQAGVRAELTQLRAHNVRASRSSTPCRRRSRRPRSAHLQANPAVQAVVPDRPAALRVAGQRPGPGARRDGGQERAVASTGPQPICPADPSTATDRARGASGHARRRGPAARRRHRRQGRDPGRRHRPQQPGPHPRRRRARRL